MIEPPQQQVFVSKPDRSITVLLNVAAGSDEAFRIHQEVVRALQDAGHRFDVIQIAPGDDFPAICKRAVTHARANQSIVVAAGGDGTVNTVAGWCCAYGVPLGIVPVGTFNYFARQLHIPDDPYAAASVVANGAYRSVTVGYVNDRLFLNNASFGLYSKIIREREHDKSRFGRYRIVAVLSAVATLLRGQRPFAVRISDGEEQQVRRTSMVFVGSNSTQLGNLDLDIARCVNDGKLAVVVMRPTKRIDILRLLLRGALKNLSGDTHLETFCADAFEMETKRRLLDVAVDGEIVRCRTPLSFRLVQGALTVIVPPEREEQ